MATIPRTDQEFNARFQDEARCREFLEHIRWPSGVRCPRCPNEEVTVMKQPRYRCNSETCEEYDFTAISETLLAGSHLPLRLWFQAMWYIVNQKNSPSAVDLQRVLGLGSNRTALRVLEIVKKAIKNSVQAPLTGSVEVDEFYLKGGRSGNGTLKSDNKILVLIAVQDGHNSKGSRLRVRRVDGPPTTGLLEAIQQIICPGGNVSTDALLAYEELRRKGYQHCPIRGSANLGDKLLPKPKRVAILLQRWLGAQRRYSSGSNLDYCLDEFAFRFNPHNANPSCTLFRRLLEQAVTTVRSNADSPLPSEDWATLREPLAST